jgi:hypothetical protein
MRINIGKIFTPGPNVIKLFTAVICDFYNKLERFCPWQAFAAYSYKHSSLVCKLKKYGRKMLYNIGPW